jgi:hypothetical protein
LVHFQLPSGNKKHHQFYQKFYKLSGKPINNPKHLKRRKNEKQFKTLQDYMAGAVYRGSPNRAKHRTAASGSGTDDLGSGGFSLFL